MEVFKMEKKIAEVKDVRCDAHNCAYNDGNNTCMAGNIKVGSPTACGSQETFCSTFMHK